MLPASGIHPSKTSAEAESNLAEQNTNSIFLSYSIKSASCNMKQMAKQVDTEQQAHVDGGLSIFSLQFHPNTMVQQRYHKREGGSLFSIPLAPTPTWQTKASYLPKLKENKPESY